MAPLSLMARQNPLGTGNVADIAVAASIAAVGLTVTWHRPRNPVGWLMLVVGVGIMFYIDGGLYNVINYRLGHRLPLGPVVLAAYEVTQPLLGLLPLAILLFPDGRLPSRRWRRLIGGYLAIGLVDMIALAQQAGQVRRGPDRGRVRGAPERHRWTRIRSATTWPVSPSRP
jgi:hypothetical protein